MDASERHAARIALTGGLSLGEMVDGLRGRRYQALVLEMLRGTGPEHTAGIALHRDLVTPEESKAVDEIVARVTDQAMDPRFWTADAGDFLVTVWHELCDALSPSPVDEPGVYNLFGLITGTLADRARTDRHFHRVLLSRSEHSGALPGRWSAATRALGNAIRDCGTGRVSERQLFAIFQEALDNGDILLEGNRYFIAPVILPLVAAGVLRSTNHLREFEGQTGMAALRGPLQNPGSFGARRRTRWWRLRK